MKLLQSVLKGRLESGVKQEVAAVKENMEIDNPV